MERVKEFCVEQIRFASSVSLSTEDNFPEGIYQESKFVDGNVVFGTITIKWELKPSEKRTSRTQEQRK